MAKELLDLDSKRQLNQAQARNVNLENKLKQAGLSYASEAYKTRNQLEALHNSDAKLLRDYYAKYYSYNPKDVNSAHTFSRKYGWYHNPNLQKGSSLEIDWRKGSSEIAKATSGFITGFGKLIK